jgi:internalin A
MMGLMAENSEGVREKIDAARRDGQNTLNFSSGDLNEIPEEVFELLQLEQLNLWGNRVRTIPERLRKLPNLRRIDVRSNPVEAVPNMPGLILDWDAYLRCEQSLSKENVMGIRVKTRDDAQTVERSSDLLTYLRDFSNLRILNLVHYDGASEPRDPAPPIKNAIEQLGDYPDLEELMLFGFLLTEVPPAIQKLRALQFLAIVDSALASVPNWLGDLKAIKSLHLRDAGLKTLPESLANLVLQSLTITGNLFGEIPAVVFRMTSLASLKVSKNPGIQEVPRQILDLPNLTELGLRPPDEIL